MTPFNGKPIVMPFRILLTGLLMLALYHPATAPVRAQDTSGGQLPNIGLTKAEEDWLRNHSTIRIGVDPAYAPYSFRDDKGRYQGIAMEFAGYLDQLLGTTMEVVPDLSWPEIVDGVRERRLDVVLTMSHRPEREAFVNFTEIYLPTPLVVMRRSGDASITSEADLDGRTVALVEGYSSTKRVLEAQPGVKPLMVKTALEGLFAVATGKADAYVGVLGINLYLAQENGITNLEVASLYGEGTNGQRFGVRKDWPQLASILDKTLAVMPDKDKRQLFERWLPARAAVPPPRVHAALPDPIRLTPEERAWIADHPVIRVMGETDYPPWDFVKDGKPVGYGVDYTKLLAERLGLELEFVIAPLGELIEKTAKRELDLMHTAYSDMHERILSSKPYGRYFPVVFRRTDRTDIQNLADLAGKRVAAVKGDAAAKTLKKAVPDAAVVDYSGYRDALLAVLEEQIDAAIMDRTVGAYLIRKHLFQGLEATEEIRATTDDPYSDMRLGVRSDWPELLALLEKAMDSVTDQELAALGDKWLGELGMPLQHIQLTASERRWLEAHPVVRVVLDPHWAPIEFRDDKGGGTRASP